MKARDCLFATMAKIQPNHCHCPPTPLKLQEMGGTVTHALQVLQTLQWQHPGGRALVQLAQAVSQDYHSYTHALLGGVEGEVTSPSGSPARLQENIELLSVGGLTGTPQRVTLLGRGGNEFSFGVHSAHVDGVGLPALPQAEAMLSVCCDQRPCLAGHEKTIAAAPITLTCQTVEQRQMTWVCG